MRAGILKGLRDRFKNPRPGESTHYNGLGVNSVPPKEPSFHDSQSATACSVSDASTPILLSADPSTQSIQPRQSLRSLQGLDPTSDALPDTKNGSEDLWQRSFDQLSSEEQCLLRNLLESGQSTFEGETQPKTFKSTDFDELIVIAEQKQEHLSGRTWNFNFCGRKFVPREYTARIIDCLTFAGDIAVPLMPQPASIIWPLVKGLMQVTIDADEETAAVLMTAEILVRNIRCGKTYEDLYREKIKDEHPELWESFQSALLKLYAASLGLLAYALKQCDKRTGRRLINALLNPSKAQDQVSDLDKARTELHAVVQACQTRIGGDVDASITNFLEKFSIFSSFIDQRFNDLFDRLDKQESANILDWISQSKPFDRHIPIRKQRTIQTCGWLLESSDFKKWESNLSPSMIWLQGLPGTGKSVLTSKVIDHLRDNLETDEGLAFYYCQRNGQTFENPNDVIRGLFRQLATPAHNSKSNSKRIRKDVRDLHLQSNDMSHPEISTCKQQIFKSLSQYSRTTLVLDALDECAEPKKELFDLLESLLSQSEYPVRVFLSARPESGVEERFPNKTTIQTSVSEVQRDINHFIEKTIVDLPHWGSISEDVQAYAIESLSDKSEGMFQWASLQIQQLSDCQMDDDIISRVEQMPMGLSDTYKQIYNQISAQKAQKLVVDRAFIWVMCSYGPMTSEQLLAAIRHDENHDQLGTKINKSKLLSLCKNLLVFDKPSNRFRFCHASVSEYIEDELWDSRRAHCYAAKSCLRFLMLAYGEPAAAVATSQNTRKSTSTLHGVRKNEESIIFAKQYPFHFYSRHLWMRHAQRQEPVEASPEGATLEMITLLKTFFGSPTKGGEAYITWYMNARLDSLTVLDSPVVTQFLTMKDICPPTLPILAMCRFGLDTVLADWWDRDEMFLSYFNENKESPLNIAARGNCFPICDRLLSRNASIDHCGEEYNALSLAAHDGNIVMAQYLIDKGADVDLALQSRHGSALALAASNGDINMAKLLIENGATIDMPIQGDLGTALATAVYYRDIDMARLLLQEGATADMEITGLRCPHYGGPFGSALDVAVATGNTEMVKLLIENGATVDLPLHGWYGSVLAVAARKRNPEMAQLLINHGATIDLAIPDSCGSALASASEYDHLDVVKCLIENGAQVNMLLQGTYGSALAAAVSCNTRSAELLIQHGATIDMVLPGLYGSALASVAHHNTEPTALLIKKGATIDMPLQGWYGSALASAAAGCEAATKILIENGATIDMPLQGRWGSALAAAGNRGSVNTAKLLIEAGANVNLMLQGWYGSALVSAAVGGRLPMTEFLINNGATIDMALPSGRFGSALAGAAAGGWVKVVRYLVDEVHANVNLPLITGNYGTALNAASHWGHTECVKILLNAGAIGDNLQPHCGFHTAIDAAQAEICERVEDHNAMTVVWRQPPGRKSIKQINADKQAAVKLLLEHNDLAESSLEVIDSKAGES